MANMPDNIPLDYQIDLKNGMGEVISTRDVHVDVKVKYERTTPSIDDWVCHKHNSHLVLFHGMARCFVDTCMDWMQRQEVQRIAATHGHWTTSRDGNVLRNLRVPAVAAEAEFMRGVPDPDLSDPTVTRWWHLFGGKVTNSASIGVVESFYFGRHCGCTELAWVTVPIGPVLTHADEVRATDRTRIRDGMALSVLIDGDTEDRLDLLGSWTHEPTQKERRDAESSPLLEEIQSLLAVHADGCAYSDGTATNGL